MVVGAPLFYLAVHLVILSSWSREADPAGKRACLAPESPKVPEQSQILFAQKRSEIGGRKAASTWTKSCTNTSDPPQISRTFESNHAESDMELQTLCGHYDLPPDALHQLPCLVGTMHGQEKEVSLQIPAQAEEPRTGQGETRQGPGDTQAHAPILYGLDGYRSTMAEEYSGEPTCKGLHGPRRCATSTAFATSAQAWARPGGGTSGGQAAHRELAEEFGQRLHSQAGTGHLGSGQSSSCGTQTRDHTYRPQPGQASSYSVRGSQRETQGGRYQVEAVQPRAAGCLQRRTRRIQAEESSCLGRSAEQKSEAPGDSGAYQELRHEPQLSGGRAHRHPGHGRLSDDGPHRGGHWLRGRGIGRASACSMFWTDQSFTDQASRAAVRGHPKEGQTGVWGGFNWGWSRPCEKLRHLPDQVVAEAFDDYKGYNGWWKVLLSRLFPLVSWQHLWQVARGLADCLWHAGYALLVGGLIYGLVVWCRFPCTEWASFSSDTLIIDGSWDETLDYASPPGRTSFASSSSSMFLSVRRRSFVTSRQPSCLYGLLCLCLCFGQAHGHDQPPDGYEPVGDRVLLDIRRRCARDVGGPERLTNRCGGSCLLARAPETSFEAPSRTEQLNDVAEDSSLMQLMAALPTRWSALYASLELGLFRLWRHPFSARHFVRSDELKGIRSTLHNGNGRFRAFIQPLGEENRILAQPVEPPPGHPSLRDVILYQDEHTYCLPLLIQVSAPDSILQGTVILDRPYGSAWIDSAELFALWDPPCHCDTEECLVLFPPLANYGEAIVVKPGSFIHLQCGHVYEPSWTDASSCSTYIGASSSYLEEPLSASEGRASDLDVLSDDEQMQDETLSIFQVETSFTPRRIDGELEHLWESHTEVRGLDRLNMDAMTFLWMMGTAPLLRVRHVDFKHRTWTTSWGDIMALTPSNLILKVRDALHEDFAPQVDLWIGAVTPQPDQAMQGHQDHFEILAQGRRGGVPSLVVFHYGTPSRPQTRHIPVSTCSPVSCQQVLEAAGGFAMCHAPGLQCACFLEGVAPFYNDRVALRGWQRIDVYVEEAERICDPVESTHGQPQTFDEDVVAFFDLGQHDAAGSSWTEERQELFDRALFHAEMDDHFDALVAHMAHLAQVVLFLADGQEAMHGFVIQNWHGQSFVNMVEHRWEHLRGLQWDFIMLRLMPSMFDFHGRMIMLIIPPAVLLEQAAYPAVVIEWTFQLRWACASFFEARAVPLLLTRNELLSYFLVEIPAVLDVSVQVNGIRQPVYGRMHLRAGDSIHVVFLWRQVQQLYLDLVASGAAEADLAYNLSPAGLPPDVFEECYMKEGRAVILLPSGEGIYSRTLFAHVHLEVYHYQLWLESWAKTRWPVLVAHPHWHLDQTHRAYRTSDLLRDLVEVFYVASETADLVHIVAELELVGLQRDIALHVKVLQTPPLVTKAYLYQQWFNVAQLEATSDLPLVYRNGQPVHQEAFEVKESDFILVGVLDPEDIREMKRQRQCPAGTSSSAAPPSEASTPSAQAAVGPSLMQQSRSLGPHRTFADILGGRERSRSPRAGMDTLKVYGEHLLAKECPCPTNTWMHAARTCVIGPDCLALPGYAMENAHVMEIYPPVKEPSHVAHSFLFAASGTLRPGQVLILAELIENVPNTIGRHSKTRRVLKVHAEYTRAQLLDDLGVTEKCSTVTCLVLQGNTMWPLGDRAPRFAACGGSYTIIATNDDDENACQPSPSDSVSLLQTQMTRRVTVHSTHTFASMARMRLPPPGNGRRVCFDDVIELNEGDGSLTSYKDPILSNEHFSGLLEMLDRELQGNEFGHRFGRLLRSPSFHDSHPWLESPEWISTPSVDPLDSNEFEDTWNFLPVREDTHEAQQHPIKQTLSLADSIGTNYCPVNQRDRREHQRQYGVDCHEIIQAMDWFICHACIPLFPTNIPWKACTGPWVQLPRWEGAPPQELHVYLDGSSIDHRAGAAVTLWVYAEAWQWAGALMHKLNDGSNAYEAEVVAHMLMMKWLHDLWRTQGRLWTHVPRVVCHMTLRLRLAQRWAGTRRVILWL